MHAGAQEKSNYVEWRLRVDGAEVKSVLELCRVDSAESWVDCRHSGKDRDEDIVVNVATTQKI